VRKIKKKTSFCAHTQGKAFYHFFFLHIIFFSDEKQKKSCRIKNGMIFFVVVRKKEKYHRQKSLSSVCLFFHARIKNKLFFFTPTVVAFAHLIRRIFSLF
jgi:hypothetical protein